MVHP
ncbi:hypothetical protein YPPY103_4693, partial [Yersinia pestis PY-103]|jgi:hypothetical protein